MWRPWPSPRPRRWPCAPVGRRRPRRAGRRQPRRDEVVGRAGEERDLAAAVAQELVRVGAAPVLLRAGAEPQVLDPGAARVDQRAERAVSGIRRSAHPSTFAPFSRSAPRCGDPRQKTWRTNRSSGARRNRRSGTHFARRPPIECPTSASSSTPPATRRPARRAAGPARGRCRKCGDRCCSGASPPRPRGHARAVRLAPRPLGLAEAVYEHDNPRAGGGAAVATADLHLERKPVPRSAMRSP